MPFRPDAEAGSTTHDEGSRTATSRARRSPTLLFLRHYVEMELVMVVGMLVLGPTLGVLAGAWGAGSAELERDAPALVILGMGFSMTAPMVLWMWWRGHSRAANLEMASAMIVPTLGALGFLVTGAVEDLETLLVIQHLVMFPAMLAVMLVRREEYTHGTHLHR